MKLVEKLFFILILIAISVPVLSLGIISINEEALTTTLYLRIENRGNKVIDDYLIIDYINGDLTTGKIVYNNTKIFVKPFRIEIPLKKLKPGEIYEIEIQGFKSLNPLPLGIKSSSDISMSNLEDNIENLDIYVVESLYNEQGISIKSLFQHYRRGLLYVEETRFKVHEISQYFLTSLWGFFVILSFAVVIENSDINRVPFITFLIVFTNLIIYCYLGSGYEILMLERFKSVNKLLGRLTFLLHTSDDHIIYNMIYFLMISIPFESWLNIRTNKKEFLVYYIIPLLYGGINKGIGISLSIEALMISIWTYIALNIDSVLSKIERGTQILWFLFIGAPFSSILNYVIYLLEYQNEIYRETYMYELAESHIFFALVFLIIFLVLNSPKFINIKKIKWPIWNN